MLAFRKAAYALRDVFMTTELVEWFAKTNVEPHFAHINPKSTKKKCNILNICLGI